jgi:cell division septum initiation protein DivIVA
LVDSTQSEDKQGSEMMASSATGGGDPETAVESTGADGAEGTAEDGFARQVSRRFPSSRASRAERDQMVEKARAIKFPVSVRGYERAAVDRYVREVNRLIAELEISSSAESAVRHALEEVSEETRDILQRAHETADEIVLRARAKAADSVQQAEREANDVRNAAKREAIEAREVAQHETEELLASARREATDLRDAADRDSEQLRTAAKAEADKMLRAAGEEADELLKSADARAREIAESADLIWRERRRLIEDVRVVGEQLLALGEAESKRFAHPAKAGATSPDGEEAPAVVQAEA